MIKDQVKQNWWQRFHQKFIVEERYVDPVVRRNLYILSAALFVFGLLTFTIILIQVLSNTGIVVLDHHVENWFDHIRSPDATSTMIALAIAFGPIALPIIILVVTVSWIIFSKHAWRPLLLAAFMLVGLIIVQITAHLVQRHRPPLNLMLFGADHTFSFPSGHVFGTSDFLLITTYLLVSRRPTKARVIIGLFIVSIGIAIQICSRLYLGYHWLSDTLASACFSLALLGIVIALDTWRTVRVDGEAIEGQLSSRQTEGT